MILAEFRMDFSQKWLPQENGGFGVICEIRIRFTVIRRANLIGYFSPQKNFDFGGWKTKKIPNALQKPILMF